VCSPGEYRRVFERANALPPGVAHVIVQVGIPIAYPRMVFLETALESKFNPLVALGRHGTMGLSGFVNKFNAEAELLDDLVRGFFFWVVGLRRCGRMLMFFFLVFFRCRTTIGRRGAIKYVLLPEIVLILFC
jgi:hypothetical protein